MKLRILAIIAPLAFPAFAHADGVRPAIGKPLQQAQALIAAQKYSAALAKLHEASAIGGLTPYETLAINELRGEATGDAGDYAQAASAYQAALASGAAPAAQKLALTQSVAGLYDRAGDTWNAIIWLNRYIAEGGEDASTRALLPQLYFQAGDYTYAAQSEKSEISHDRAAGQKPMNAQWQLLAAAAQKSGDAQTYQTALNGLLVNDPSPAYWASAIGSLQAQPGFPDSLQLDVYRLRRATGTLTAPGDYEDYAERAILAGQPQEARAVIAQGFANHSLTDQTDAGHAQRLQTLLASAQENHPDLLAQTPLDQAIATFQAGNNRAALAAFNQVAAAHAATDPEASLARLWAIRAATSFTGYASQGVIGR
jgi:tetratricopeptide (TPR) repeat protein